MIKTKNIKQQQQQQAKSNRFDYLLKPKFIEEKKKKMQR